MDKEHYVWARPPYKVKRHMEECEKRITLGDSCHIWQYFKVSIKLRTLAVLWTHFCVDKTADLGSFMDTFSMSRILPDLGSFVDTFRLSELKITKTADLSSFMDTFRLSELIFNSGVHKTADLGSSMDTFRLSPEVILKLYFRTLKL